MKPPLEQTHDEWLADYDGRVTPEPVNEVYPPDNDQGEGMVEEKALLPAGEYQAIYLEHGLQPNFKGYGDKLVVSFTVTKTDVAGEIVNAYYNIQILKTGWKAKGGSRWVSEMRRLFPERKRKDRLPPSLLKNRNVLVEVRTVQTGRAKRVLEQHEQYSIVSNIVRLLD